VRRFLCLALGNARSARTGIRKHPPDGARAESGEQRMVYGTGFLERLLRELSAGPREGDGMCFR